MLRTSLILLLTCASLPAMAQNGRAIVIGTDATPCSEIADKRVHSGADASVAAASKQRGITQAPRAKAPSSPTGLPAAPGSRGGGGDEGNGDLLSRPRSPKWHSFLPGMFR